MMLISRDLSVTFTHRVTPQHGGPSRNSKVYDLVHFTDNRNILKKAHSPFIKEKGLLFRHQNS